MQSRRRGAEVFFARHKKPLDQEFAETAWPKRVASTQHSLPHRNNSCCWKCHRDVSAAIQGHGTDARDATLMTNRDWVFASTMLSPFDGQQTRPTVAVLVSPTTPAEIRRLGFEEFVACH